jgi:hypothetical protein
VATQIAHFWSDNAIEDPARLLEGENLPRREEGISSNACTMPHFNHVGFVGRLEISEWFDVSGLCS